MIVRFGSARMTASSTSSSTTTITRSAAKAASFWQPSRPQTWVSPPAVARWAWTIVDVRAERRHRVDRPVAVGRVDRPDQRVGDRQVRLEVGAQREEGQVHGARRVPPDHPEVAVLLELERLVRDLALDPPADRAEPADARVAEPGEDELAGDAGGDHLVVDEVRRQAGQRQVALALADDLVAGGEADEVGEALDRDGVAVADELGDGVAHRRDLGGGAHSRSSGSVASRTARRSAGRLDLVDRAAPGGRQDLAASPATAATASPKIRSAVAISASVTVSAGDIRTLDLPHSRTSRPRWKQAHWTSSACSAVSNSTPIIRPLPRTSRTSAGNRSRERPQPGHRLLAAGRGVVDEAALEQVDRRERGGAGDRVAAVGRAVGARAPGLEQLGPGDHRAERHARGDALGRQQDVRLDAPVLDRPHLAGPAGARLDLVGDQQDPVLVADLAQALEEAVLGDDVAALALDRLDDDRRDLVGRGELVEQDLVEPAQVLDPAVRRVEDARQQRPEAGVVLRLRGGQRDRAVGPAVERAEERDDVRPLRRVAGELDRGLDDLGAGVAEVGPDAADDRRDPGELAADLRRRSAGRSRTR